MLGQLASKVRALDAFPKVEDSQREKSASGGFATLLVLAVLTYFTWGEFSTYFSPVQRHEFLVDHTINHELRINFDVTVAMSCKYLTVDDIDVTGSH
ncbi:Endoplasmic reticulum-Golgi intermediate compartment protein 2, partial [Dispira simplex]